MAKIPRKHQKIFGENASTQEVGVFGSLAAGSPETNKDPEQIQRLSNFLMGWYAGVLGQNSPAIEDMNALFFVLTYQLSYMFQMGIAEWDDDTEYHQFSIVNYNGTYYISKVDTNENHAPDDPDGDDWWDVFTYGIDASESDFINATNNVTNPSIKEIRDKNQTFFETIYITDIANLNYVSRVAAGIAALQAKYPNNYPSGGFNTTHAYLWKFKSIPTITDPTHQDLNALEMNYVWNGYFWQPENNSVIFEFADLINTSRPYPITLYALPTSATPPAGYNSRGWMARLSTKLNTAFASEPDVYGFGIVHDIGYTSPPSNIWAETYGFMSSMGIPPGSLIELELRIQGYCYQTNRSSIGIEFTTNLEPSPSDLSSPDLYYSSSDPQKIDTTISFVVDPNDDYSSVRQRIVQHIQSNTGGNESFGLQWSPSPSLTREVLSGTLKFKRYIR